MQSLVFVCPSVRLFLLHLLNQLTFKLHFVCMVGHDHSSPKIEIQGHRSRSKIQFGKCAQPEVSNLENPKFCVNVCTYDSFTCHFCPFRFTALLIHNSLFLLLLAKNVTSFTNPSPVVSFRLTRLPSRTITRTDSSELPGFCY